MYTSTFYCFLFFSSILLGHEFAGQLRPSATLSWDDHQVSFIRLPQKSAIDLPLVAPISQRVEYGPELPPGYGVLASNLPVSETEVEGVCTADEAPKPSALSCLWAALNSLGAHWLDRVRLIILDPESALTHLYKVRPPVEALASTPPSITLVLPPVEDLEEADGEEEVVLPTKGEEEEDEAPEIQQVQVGSTWYSVVETSAADGQPACASPNASLSTLTPRITLVQPTASDNSDSQVDYVNDFLNSTVIHRVNEIPLIDLMQIFSLVAGLLFAAFLSIAGRVEEIKEKNVAEAEQRSQLQYRRVLKLMRVRKISHFIRSHVRSLTYRNGKLRRSVKKTKGQLETSHSRFISLLSLLSSSHLRESSSNETISLRNQLALVEAQLEKSHSSMVSLLSSSQQRETTANESILSLCSQYMKVEKRREEKSKEVEEKSKEVEEKSKEVEEKSKEVEAITTAKQEVEERLKNSLALIAVLTSHIASLKEDNKEQRRKEEEREEQERQLRKEEEERQEAERLQREEIEREEKERAQREIEIVAAMKEDELARRVRQEEEDKRRREAKEAEEQRKKEMDLREKALAVIRAREAEAKKAAEAKKVEEKRAEAERRAEEKKAEEKRAEEKKDVGTHVEKKYTPYSHFNTSKRSKKLAKMAKKLQQSPDTTVDHVPVPVAPQQQKEKEKEIKKQEKKRDFRPSEVYRPPRTAAAHYPQE